jgi:hypothetical protein
LEGILDDAVASALDHGCSPDLCQCLARETAIGAQTQALVQVCRLQEQLDWDGSGVERTGVMWPQSPYLRLHGMPVYALLETEIYGSSMYLRGDRHGRVLVRASDGDSRACRGRASTGGADYIKSVLLV